MRISDWSSDVCSSDLYLPAGRGRMTSRSPDAAAERAKQIVVTMGFALPSESANRAFSGVGRRKMHSKFGFPRFTVLRLSHHRKHIWGSVTLAMGVFSHTDAILLQK